MEARRITWRDAQYPELRCVMSPFMPAHRSFQRIICLCFGACGILSWGQYEVSSWRDHYSYQQVHHVSHTNDRILGLTSTALFAVDTGTFEVERWVKGSPLSQANPTCSAYDSTRNQTLIGYADGSLDILNDWGVRNVPDLRLAQITGAKRIHDILIEDSTAYLATTLGVVVFDLAKQEIADTWAITSFANRADVRSILHKDGRWIVGTSEGIYQADDTNLFLGDPAQWELWDHDPGLGPVTELTFFGGSWWLSTEFVHPDTALVWRFDGVNPWGLLEGWSPDGMAWGGMAVGAWLQNDEGQREQGLLIASCCQAWGWDADGSSVTIPNQVPSFADINDLALMPNDSTGKVWLASDYAGLVTWTPMPDVQSAPTRTTHPPGPPNGNVRRMDCWNDNLWVATGGVDLAWVPLYKSDGFYHFSDEAWTQPILPQNANDIAGVKDIMDVSIDPTNTSHVVFSSYEEGLIELLDGEVVRVLNSENSTIEDSPLVGSGRSITSGVDFDRDGNLWFANPGVQSCLQVMLPNGNTVPMDVGDLGLNVHMGDIEVTRDGYVWVALPRGRGVLVYDPAGTPALTQDDNWVVLTATEGQGGLPSNNVYCIEEDLDGEIWVGTSSGLAVFYQSESLFEGEVNASQILISQDGNLQYLLETEVIQSMLIDAGNRKWVGTQGSGVYVLSADGLTTDHHHTLENSPLPSNDIQDIAINHANGEVFLGTSRGIVSFRGEATNWDRTMDNVRIMPNPIRADHSGPIIIDGLAYQSTVHITDVSGRRIAQLESYGGRVTWDGLLENGQSAPFGVYLAFATDQNGKEGAVIKFAILR